MPRHSKYNFSGSEALALWGIRNSALYLGTLERSVHENLVGQCVSP